MIGSFLNMSVGMKLAVVQSACEQAGSAMIKTRISKACAIAAVMGSLDGGKSEFFMSASFIKDESRIVVFTAAVLFHIKEDKKREIEEIFLFLHAQVFISPDGLC